MANFGAAAASATLTACLLCGVMPAATAVGDLSRYRDFQLGMDLSTVVKLTGASSSQAKIIQSRPALIQELEWRPRPYGPSSRMEAAQEVFFTFFDGALYRVVVNYDRYETEGLTSGDMVEAISAAYGIATKPPLTAKAVAQVRYGDEDEVLAQWQDPQYRFELVRSAYGPHFSLIGVLKRLEAPAQSSILEAKRLDDQEAPQRDAARAASDEEAAKAKSEKARLVNKPNFRP